MKDRVRAQKLPFEVTIELCLWRGSEPARQSDMILARKRYPWPDTMVWAYHPNTQTRSSSVFQCH